MLVSFSVKNYRSFADKQTLSLVASTSSKKQSNFSFSTENSYAPNLLNGACILGSNGSGKTSLVKAITFFRKFIIESAKQSQEGDSINVTPHLFSSKLSKEPSEFEIIFIYKDSLYRYGFSVDKKRVYEEWMFAKPNDNNSRMRNLFCREYDKETDSYKWDINATFVKGKKQTWKESTRSNSLFLSQAVQLNAESFKPPFEWLKNYLKTISSAQRLSNRFTIERCIEDGWKRKIISFLNSLDIRIANIDIQSKEFDPKILSKDMPSSLKEKVTQTMSRQKIDNVYSIHKTAEGDNIRLEMDDESKGTSVLFSLAGSWLDTLNNGNTLIIDELNNSLHPQALKKLVSMFHNPKTNPKNAQLIFTSHEISVIDKDFMHQDQIYLIEKSDTESSELIALSNYKVRDVLGFQKAYLNGRFGGIPKLKDFVNGN